LLEVNVKYQTCLHKEILKVLTYFGIFRHPLLLDEILSLLLTTTSKNELLNELLILVNQELISEKNGYYFLGNDVSSIQKRLIGEVKAANILPKAKKVGILISYFPFVRFVGISGSLSKGYADDKTDYDYFVITSKNNLWICRSILHLFKKLTFLAGKQHCFCMNYFVDESAIEIKDKNIFAMYEITSLIPVYNSAVYSNFTESNIWVKNKLPQFNYKKFEIKNHNNLIKRAIEIILSVFPLSIINKALMKITDYKWKRKWTKEKYPMNEYDLAFRTRINISKNHPKNHQKFVLSKLSKLS
jgi:hypothetical protein